MLFRSLGAGRTATTTYYYPGVTQNVYGYNSDISFLLRPSKSTGLNGLFVRLGGHYDLARVTYSSFYANGWAAKWGGGALIGLGYDVDLNDNFSTRISYSYLDNVAGSNYNANEGSIGLIYKF